MKKSELILAIHDKNPFLSQEQIHQIIDIVFNEITNGLKSNRRIEIRGFGAFSVRQRNVQQSFHKHNSPMIFTKKNTVYFRMGKEFFEKLNND